MLATQARMQTAAWGTSAGGGAEHARSSAARITAWGLPGGPENSRTAAGQGGGSAKHGPSATLDMLCKKLDDAIRWELRHGLLNSKVGQFPLDLKVAAYSALSHPKRAVSCQLPASQHPVSVQVQSTHTFREFAAL